MNKISLIHKYFQKSNQLTVGNNLYQQSISSLFQWLIENDKVEADKTTKYFPDNATRAIIMAKQNGIIAGLEEVEFLLKKNTKIVLKPQITDGNALTNKKIIAEIQGNSHEILAYERTILNILQRMSGIATETYNFIDSINRQQITDNKKPYIAATRKTPWMSLDKKAVAIGGGLTHRLSLSDGILVKDNHLSFVSIENALQILISKYQNELIEIEVTDAKQAFKTISIFNRLNNNNHLAIMFDNFTPENAKKAIGKLGKNFDLTNIIFEGSGGIDENNLIDWVSTGVDFISLGSLTHSTHAVNLSLEIIT